MQYNIKCPLCGEENKNLLLEETNGWFVCDKCKNEIMLPQYSKKQRIPLLNEKILKEMFQNR